MCIAKRPEICGNHKILTFTVILLKTPLVLLVVTLPFNIKKAIRDLNNKEFVGLISCKFVTTHVNRVYIELDY